jgi:hypothetical protein
MSGDGMIATRFWQLLLAFVTLGVIWAGTTPAQAQLAAGCTCPAGFSPLSGSTCFTSPRGVFTPTAAICPLRNVNVGQIAASQQQQSFWGVNQMLQQKRDQLQATPVIHTATYGNSGYASSDLDGSARAMSYSGSGRSQKADPFAGLINEAAPIQSNPIFGGWVQGLADWEHDNALSSADLGRFNSTYTVQAGFDRTTLGVLSGDDAWVFGIVSSETSSRVSFDNTPTSLRLTGPGVGAYSEYVRGGFSTDVTAKFDFLQLTQDFGGVAPDASVSVLNSGVSGNVQYKFSGTHNEFFEPTMGFSLTHVSFGSGGDALNLEDGYTVRLQAGARVGKTWDLGQGVSVDANFKALVYGDAVGQGTVASGATVGGVLPLAPTDAGLIRTELDPEICFNLPNDYSVTVSGQARFGEAVAGGSVGVNLRKQW